MNKLGIDIGRVIITPGDGNNDTSFIGGSLVAAMATPPMKGAFETIKFLVEVFGADNVWLVSKCGLRIQKRSRLWLSHYEFFEQTGMSPEHIRFCRKRHEKAPICKELSLTHFIDDRVDCLSPMDGVAKFLFGPQKRKAPAGTPPMVPVLTWADVRDIFEPRQR